MSISSTTGLCHARAISAAFASGGVADALISAIISSTFASATAGDKRGFWIAAMFAGLAIGSVQAASRALVGLFSPVDKSGEFFGLWGLAGKAAYALGGLLFGWVASGSGSQRAAVWVNGIFFVAGFLLLFLVDERRGRAAAEAWSPGAGAH